MAKSIITQNGSVINYCKLLAIYVDDNVIGYDLIGVTGAEKNSQALILGSYADEQSAENAKADIIRQFQREAFSTFEMPTADNGGDA